MDKSESFYINKKVNWIYIALITISLTYYSTFIFPIDRPDFENYQVLFNHISYPNPGSEQNFIFKKDFVYQVNGFGFYLYVKFISLFTNSFRTFIGLTAFFSISIKIFLINKLSKNIYFSSLIYCFLVFPIHELIQIRLGLATSLLFLTLFIFNKRTYLISLILLIISFSIHLVTLPLAAGGLIIKTILLILKSKKISLKINKFSFYSILILIIISLIRFASLEKNLNYYFSGHLNFPANLFSIRSALLLFITIIGLKRFDKFPDHVKNWFCLSLVGVSSYYIFSNNMNVASRVIQSTYFTFIIWINYMPKKDYIFLRYLLFLVSLIFIYLFITR